MENCSEALWAGPGSDAHHRMLTPHWPELSHVVLLNCKGGWEVNLAVQAGAGEEGRFECSRAVSVTAIPSHNFRTERVLKALIGLGPWVVSNRKKLVLGNSWSGHEGISSLGYGRGAWGTASTATGSQ